MCSCVGVMKRKGKEEKEREGKEREGKMVKLSIPSREAKRLNMNQYKI